ncbi:protein ROS1A-like [Elaeis guineensis]|uniref:protein ROS1A-like n=1 Tax=Elaeis guineensis var. tenera TaxID=51953 RepID=UPI003C6D084D
MDSSTSFTELLRIAELGTHGYEMIPSTDYCGAMDRFAQLDVDKRHTVLNPSEKLKGALPSMQTSDSYIYDAESDILRVSCDPFIPYNFDNSKNSRLVGMHNANVARDESRCPHFSTPSGNMNTNKINFMTYLCGPLANNAIEDIDLQHEYTEKLQRKETEANFHVENTLHAVKVPCQKQNSQNQQIYPDIQNNQRKALEMSRDKYGLKAKKTRLQVKKRRLILDSLRKEAYSKGANIERSYETMDSLDWDAAWNHILKSFCSNIIAIHAISWNVHAEMMLKEFLDRLVRDHGSINLEWLRDVEPDKAKDYLLSIRGLGLKSVECVRLLTLHHLAFPVDTNVGRICVRLGWVPLQPLPESLQLHLLELYPILETIQKYLWPRLCKLDQRTLYELHYQMITFGKVFCTKSKPNCNACPMRGECKHFASAFASARLALPGPEEKSLMSSAIPIASENGHLPSCNFPLPQLEGGPSSQERTVFNNCEPIIEEPATPEAECLETEKSAIEDAFFEDPDEIPTIKLNFEEFAQNLQNYMQVHNMDIQDGDMSKALVAIAPEAASIPMPKLKNVSRLRTEHQVYELPDSHPLLEGLDRREPDDPCSYLLAIWTPGETAQSTEPPKAFCNSQETGKLCDRKICFACNSIREAQAQTVRGTLLIPCRTAMRGSFPLNGTYFQVNEVFADHDTSCNPIDVPREWIWNLPRRTVYFGTSIPTIFKGLTTEGIQQCFWRGFVCVRGFDRTTRAPKPLYARLHFPASKALKNKKAAAAAAREK